MASEASITWVDGWPHRRRVAGLKNMTGDVEPIFAPGEVRYTEREVDALLCERVLGWERDGDGETVFAKPTLDFAHDVRAAMLLGTAISNESRFLLRTTWGRQTELFDFNRTATKGGQQPVEIFPHMNDGKEAEAIRLASLKALELQMQEAGKSALERAVDAAREAEYEETGSRCSMCKVGHEAVDGWHFHETGTHHFTGGRRAHRCGDFEQEAGK